MDFAISAQAISTEEVQAELDRAMSAPELRQLLESEDVGVDADIDGFHAQAGEEGFGAVELILIAAGGRLLASVPERIIVRIFDEVVWPRLKAKFGSSVERKDEDGK